MTLAHGDYVVRILNIFSRSAELVADRVCQLLVGGGWNLSTMFLGGCSNESWRDVHPGMSSTSYGGAMATSYGGAMATSCAERIMLATRS